MKIATFIIFILAQTVTACNASAQTVTFEYIDGAIRACAAGGDLEYSADIKGSIESLFNGSQSKGSATLRSSTAFLRLVPEGDRSEAYKIYINCILAILNPDLLKGTPDKTELVSLLTEKSNFDALDDYLLSVFRTFKFIKFPQDFPQNVNINTIFQVRKYYGNEYDPYIFSSYLNSDINITTFNSFLIETEASGLFPAYTVFDERVRAYQESQATFAEKVSASYPTFSSLGAQVGFVGGNSFLDNADALRDLPKLHEQVRNRLRDIQDAYCDLRESFEKKFALYRAKQRIVLRQINACSVVIDTGNMDERSPERMINAFGIASAPPNQSVPNLPTIQAPSREKQLADIICWGQQDKRCYGGRC